MKKHSKNVLYFLLSIITIVIINKFIFVISIIKNKLQSCNSYYYQWKFGKVFYTIQGEGPSILLIHSFNRGSSGREYKRLIKRLSTKHTVYTVDLIGFGCSDKPKITYTAFLYVQLISDFINNVIKEKTDVVASSLSSAYVTMACYQNPDIFNKLLYISPTSLATLHRNPGKRDKVLKYILESPIIGTTIYNIACSKYMLKAKLKKDLYHNKKNVSSKIVDFYHEASHLQGVNNKYLYASQCSKYLNVSTMDALASINNSIYIIMGNTPHVEEVRENYLAINPAIEHSFLNNAKELPHLEQPAEVMDICHIYFNN